MNNLSFILKSRNLNIKQLATYCDIGYESLIKLVNNPEKLPNAENLKSLCESLQTTPQTIFFYAGISPSMEKEFFSKEKSEQEFITNCSRYFVVLVGNYFTRHEDLLLPFDMSDYKNLTDDNGRQYHTLENLFSVIEYFEGLYYLSLNITDELAEPSIAEYDAKIEAWREEYELSDNCSGKIKLPSEYI